MPGTAPWPFEEDPHICLCDCLFLTVAQKGIIIRKDLRFILWHFSASISRYKILGLGMVDDDGVGALLGLQVELLGEAHADVLLGLEQAEDLRLVLEVGAGGIAEGVTRAAIFLVEEIGDARRVFAGDAEQLARLLVDQLGQRLGGLHREAVQIEILCKVAGLEELCGLAAGLVADGDDGEADDIALRLQSSGSKKSAMESRRPCAWRGKVMRSSSRLGSSGSKTTSSSPSPAQG